MLVDHVRLRFILFMLEDEAAAVEIPVSFEFIEPVFVGLAPTVLIATVFIINNSGEICYADYQNSLIKEPDNQEPLAILSKLNKLE